MDRHHGFRTRELSKGIAAVPQGPKKFPGHGIT